MQPRSRYAASHCLSLLGIVFGSLCEVQAGTVQGVNLVPGTRNVLASASFATVKPNDFNNLGGPTQNTVTVVKGLFANPADLNFTVQDSGGVTRYAVSETVFNGTGSTWTDFQFELGYFSGNKFVVSNLLDGLDFDVGITKGMEDKNKPLAPIPTSNMFGSSDNRMDPNILTFTNGAIPPLASVTFNFVIDVPDFNKNMPAGAAIPGGYNFTLRELFSVPEPSSLILLGTGTLVFLTARVLGGRVRRGSKD
jgi:hypothetical protein